MRRRQKLFIASIALAGIAMGLFLTAVVTVRLLANREMVRSLITTKTARATGGTLDYDRLSVNFFPLPHLEAEGIGLHRPKAFDIKADQLSVYPMILPLLKGRLSIRRLVVEAPDLRFAVGPAAPPGTGQIPSAPDAQKPVEEAIRTAVGGLFGSLAAIEPGTDLLIQEGTITLAPADAPDLRFTGIQLYGENNGGNLSLKLECRSAVTGRLNMSLQADSAARTARGTITADGLNLRPILHYASLPGDVLTENTHARVESSFTIDGPEKLSSRFSLGFPTLAVRRKGLKLDLDAAFISGGLTVGNGGVALSVDTLRSVRPDLNLSADARIFPDGKTGRSVIDIQAAASQLDVAAVGLATQAIAGDLEDIRTAFAVAREGVLTDVTYDVRFETAENGYRLQGMQASGHIDEGRVTIPGIDADLERMEGDIDYRDSHVAFKKVSGHFNGATFEKLDAAIDWSQEPTLSIASRAVRVDAKPFTEWLFSFEELAPVQEYVQSIDGSARLARLTIEGPLTDPARWDFRIHGTPENIRLDSPLVPYTAGFAGGEIVYTPGNEKATGVAVTFLDGSVVASFESRGILNPESIRCQLDGSMGPQAIDWLSTILPIPKHLQMKPPVDLTGVNIAWSDTGGTSFKGSVKTAGGVELFADVGIFPRTWNIRRIQFADGRSQAVISARKEAQQIEIAFTGHVEKATADRLLESNRSLAGRLEGDFRAIIDTHKPMNSAFAGHLSGKGLHIRQLFPNPVEVQHFSIDGRAGQILVAPSTLLLEGHQLVVDGSLINRSGNVTFDLNVNADQLDIDLIRSIQAAAGGEAAPGSKLKGVAKPTFNGTLRIRTNEFAYEKLIWSPVEATVHVDSETTRVDISRADLCGIATTGELAFSPAGMQFAITPTATAASIQETADCFWGKKMQAEARFDLTGEIQLPETAQDPLPVVTGRLEFLSQNGRIAYSSMLMKIFAVLNVTEVFAGSSTDLTEKGYGYATARVKAGIGGGKLHLEEILLDGNSLKITGQGSIDLKSQNVDIKLLAAPLKTVDRVVNKIPVIRYIVGGSLISIPLRVTGKLHNVAVATMSPSDVGMGLLNLMGRTLNAPFKLVEQAASLATGSADQSKQAPDDAAAPGN